jgi:penicillin-binding protein 1A
MRVRHGSRVARLRRRRQGKKRDGVGQALLIVLFLTPFFALLLGLGTITFGLRAAAAVSADLPKLEEQRKVELAETSRIFAANGDLLAYLHGVENRQIVGSERIPQLLKDAVVAIEDERFYQHQGVDFQGIARALYKDIQAGAVVEGASTITQQLVGTLYLDRTDQSVSRKLNEMALAWQLETKMSKDEILDLYLNTVYFGSNAYGVMAASRTYFDKDPAELSLPEAALLAGLPQAPSAFSPRTNPDSALVRRNLVLQRMYVNGFATLEEYEEARQSAIRLSEASPYARVQEPYVVAYVRKQLIDMFGEDMVFKGGLWVETTINPAYQKHGEKAIREELNRDGDPSAALVAIETSTGYVRAMVGGSDYDKSKFNLAAQGRRQPGSAFKTFALVAAVEMGMNPATTYYDSKPLSIEIPGSRKPWNVKTFGNDYYGASNLVSATLRSDNSVYAQLAMDLGAEAIADVAHRMGIQTEVNKNPAIVLGGLTHGVSPLEMASAYGTLARAGEYIEPTLIVEVRNSKGEVLYDRRGKDKPEVKQAISPGVAYIVTDIMRQNVTSGTGRRAIIGRPVAGKTGTAQDYRDAWFAGYAPQLSTAVWVGHPEAQIEMRNVHGIRVVGGSFPAAIWGRFMRTVMTDFPVAQFEKPSESVVFKPQKKESNYQLKSTATTKGTGATGSGRSGSTATTQSGGSGATTTTAKPTPTTAQPTPTTRPPSTAPPTTGPPPTSPPSTQPPPTSPPPTDTPTTAPPSS